MVLNDASALALVRNFKVGRVGCSAQLIPANPQCRHLVRNFKVGRVGCLARAIPAPGWLVPLLEREADLKFVMAVHSPPLL